MGYEIIIPNSFFVLGIIFAQCSACFKYSSCVRGIIQALLSVVCEAFYAGNRIGLLNVAIILNVMKTLKYF